jgi:alpha-tubulin suppressor-like RCC1 family protein
MALVPCFLYFSKYSGQFGLNDRTMTGNISTPKNPLIKSNLIIKSVHAGYAHNVIITDTGIPYGFGHNREAQLVDSNNADVHIPTLMASCINNGPIVDCSCGQYSVALLTGNMIVCHLT